MWRDALAPHRVGKSYAVSFGGGCKGERRASLQVRSVKAVAEG